MKKIRSTRTINFRDTHKGRGFAFRGIDRQLAFSHKRRAPRTWRWDEGDSRIAYFGATRPRNARLRPRGQIIPEVVIEAPGLPRRGSRGLIYDLPATARPARIQGVAEFGGRGGANVISQAKSLRGLTSIAAESMRWWAIPCETLQIPARLDKFPVRRHKIPWSDF